MTTRLADLPSDDLAAILAGDGLSLDFGGATARVRSDLDGLASVLRLVYGEFSHVEASRFHDITVRLRHRRGLRRFFAPQIELESDAAVMFEPFPAHTHLPLLEWGVNYLFAQRLHHRLLLHAGVVEVSAGAVLMPALPGTGKSTLTAALLMSGGRLLSDEFGMVGLEDGLLYPLVRPISLKNDAIDIVAAFAPQAVMGPRFAGTRKGTVAHLAPDAASWTGRSVPARPALVVFPKYERGASLRVEPMSKARAFGKLAVNSFNYEILGPAGFDAVGRLLHASEVFRLTYSDLSDAVTAIRDLAASGAVS